MRAYEKVSGVSELETARLRAQARASRALIDELHWRSQSDEVADLGCGPGAAFALFADAGFSGVIAVDRSEAAVAQAGCEAGHLGLRFTGIEASLEDHDSLPEGIVDSALAMYVCIHAGTRSVLRAAHRMLSPRGWLAVSDRSYSQTVVAHSAPVLDLAHGVERLILDTAVDLMDIDATASAEGFGVELAATEVRHYRGAETLAPFAFIETMNGSEQARGLKGLFRAARESDLSRAEVRVTDRRFLLRRMA